MFFAGSIRKGKIIKVDANGNITTFADKPSLKTVLGLTIDEKRNQLIVCNADPGFSEKTAGSNPPELANVVVFDINNGQELASYDLSSLTTAGSPHLTNDLALDADGNLYVTDSFSPAIYKITPAGQISLLLLDASLAPAENSFGLNGIEVHPDGYLIVAHYSQGALYKVPLNDPAHFQKIQLLGTINTADGIRMLDAQTLLVASNSFSPSSGYKDTVYRLKSTDDWSTANVEAAKEATTVNAFPTTITLADGEAFVVYSFLPELAVKQNPDVEEFFIKKIKFD